MNIVDRLFFTRPRSTIDGINSKVVILQKMTLAYNIQYQLSNIKYFYFLSFLTGFAEFYG